MRIAQFIQSSVLLAIGSTYDTIWRNLNLNLKKEGCSLLQAVILISIFFEATESLKPTALQDSVTPSRLAKTFNTSRGNVSHCLSHLEKQGFIKRTLDTKDARSYRLVLRPDGKKTALRLIKIIDDLETFFERKIGKQEVGQLIDGLGRAKNFYLENSSK